jgi:hypothetical protein
MILKNIFLQKKSKYFFVSYFRFLFETFIQKLFHNFFKKVLFVIFCFFSIKMFFAESFHFLSQKYLTRGAHCTQQHHRGAAWLPAACTFVGHPVLEIGRTEASLRAPVNLVSPLTSPTPRPNLHPFTETRATPRSARRAPHL